MELRQLQTFVQAAKLQSFSRAASQLGYYQSAVTVRSACWRKNWEPGSLTGWGNRWS